MKKYICTAKESCKATSGLDRTFPRGYREASIEELEDMGFDMDPEYEEETKEFLREEDDLELLGYAVNRSEDLAFIVRDMHGSSKTPFIVEIEGGRIFDIED